MCNDLNSADLDLTCALKDFLTFIDSYGTISETGQLYRVVKIDTLFAEDRKKFNLLLNRLKEVSSHECYRSSES